MRARLPLFGGIAGAVLGGAVVVALLLLLVAGKTYRIESQAMEPALRQGEYVYALRVWLPGELERGDIVAYRIPEEALPRCGGPPGTYVHRISLVTREGLFVQGDNRTFSCDSRVFGPVEEERVVAEVVAVVWPPSRWGFR